MSRNIAIALAALVSVNACAPAALDSGAPDVEVEWAHVPSDQDAADASSHHLILGGRLALEGIQDSAGQLDLFLNLEVDGARYEGLVSAAELKSGARSEAVLELLDHVPADLLRAARVAAEQDDRMDFSEAQLRVLEGAQGVERGAAGPELDLDDLLSLGEDACAELGGELGWTMRLGEASASWTCQY
ncbi:MAG: hypothetical protein H6740_22290 [Alphaproteobacteria bacterium]|nr:hypothetical protein [Alphaproteobacteria bacterium]